MNIIEHILSHQPGKSGWTIGASHVVLWKDVSDETGVQGDQTLDIVPLDEFQAAMRRALAQRIGDVLSSWATPALALLLCVFVVGCAPAPDIEPEYTEVSFADLCYDCGGTGLGGSQPCTDDCEAFCEWVEERAALVLPQMLRPRGY